MNQHIPSVENSTFQALIVSGGCAGPCVAVQAPPTAAHDQIRWFCGRFRPNGSKGAARMPKFCETFAVTERSSEEMR